MATFFNVTTNISNIFFEPLIEELTNAFNTWVHQIRIPNRKIFKFNDDSLFLSFNYTETLQKNYNIKDILHIHGQRNTENKIIFGHNNEIYIPSEQGSISQEENRESNIFDYNDRELDDEEQEASDNYVLSTCKPINKII